MRAADRYEITVEPPPKWMVPGLALLAYCVGLATKEMFTYGRRRATIRDRVSGELVGCFKERWIVGGGGAFGWMLTHAETMTADEFDQRWLESDDNACRAGNALSVVRSVRLLPAFVVDRLPIAWWRPGNLRHVLGGDLHFCDENHVRTIEWNSRTVAQGKAVFPYDHEWQ